MRGMVRLGAMALNAFVLLGGLAGCGGGGSGDAQPGTSVPAAQADTYNGLAWNESSTLDVLGNDSISGNGTPSLVGVGTPGHGSAQIAGNSIVYTPAANYFGTDSFSYTIGSAAGGATASANVSVTVNAAMTVRGKATDEPLANASITVRVGAGTYTGTTDALGHYSIPIRASSPDDFISITAQGSGAQSHVRLVSLAGDSRTAASATGTDGILVAGELPGVNVTNVTTALYALATVHNNGIVPNTQSSLDAAIAGVRSGELVQMAAMIKLVADAGTGISLPSGATDTLTLVTSPAIYTPFAEGIVRDNATQLASTVTAVLSDPDLTTAPSIQIDAAKSLAFYFGVNCCAEGAMELTLRPDGTATLLNMEGRHQGSWVNSDNAITVTYAQPVVTTGFDGYGTLLSTTSHRIRQLSGTPDGGTVSITFGGSLSYPGKQKPPRQMSAATGDVAIYAFSDVARLSAPTAAELVGSTFSGFSYFIPNGTHMIDQFALTFAADGTAQSPHWKGDIGWKLDNGKLVINHSSGIQLTAMRLSAAASGEEHWLIRARNSEGDFAVGEAMMVKNQDKLAFTDAMAQSLWLSNASSGAISKSQFYVHVQGSHEGQLEVAYLDGTRESFGPFNWQVDSGTLVMRNYVLQDDSESATCPPGALCSLLRERNWSLLRQSGTSIFVFEQTNVGNGYRQFRINRYEKAGN